MHQRTGGVVLTGGTATRLGGADKAGLVLDGVPLLERALAALAGVPDVVVVRPEVPTTRPVTWAREDPPGGGPAAALLAGLDALPSPDLLVALAVDMPLVAPATVERLLRAVEGYDGAVLVDHDGRDQPLCAVYRAAALSRARPDDTFGLPLKRLVGSLRLNRVPAVGHEAQDVDTWDDLDLLQRERRRTNLEG